MIDIQKYLLLCLLTATVSISQQTDDVITPTSVNVLALLGSNISLGWTVSISDDDIKWCFWQFKPNGESTWTRLVGWDNINKERIGMSPLKQDISFLASKPCTGGIMIHSVTNQYEGVYQFSIIENLEDKQHITIQGIGVKLIKEHDLVYQIAVGSTRYVITSDTSISDIKPVVTRENNVNISAAATGVPATFNISFYKGKNRAKIETCEKDPVCLKSSGVRLTCLLSLKSVMSFIATMSVDFKREWFRLHFLDFIKHPGNPFFCILDNTGMVPVETCYSTCCVDDFRWVLGVAGAAAKSGVDPLSVVGDGDMSGFVCVGLLAWVILPFGIDGHGWGEPIGGDVLICDLHKDVNQFYVNLKTKENVCVSLEKDVTQLNAQKEHLIQEMNNITDQLDEKENQCQSLINQMGESKMQVK
ncbi:hypothetical protein LSH36_564g01006 [Paralvinella palmiformis]|uniref:Uncharacterized protein n=1 Tax=Paralvinella palmiformis TaxID=53620 RepID=A0AAD9J6Q8_9ANNE|nr:hypothetical protein LSH36_564g01006 [Paralvinella palmiformis]